MIDRLNLFSKLECRNDRAWQTQYNERQWLVENEVLWYPIKDIGIAGRANWSRTKNPKTKNTMGRFHELGAGLAYRPVEFDRLNVLAKYSYLTDLPPGIQNSFRETTDSRSHIVGIEGSFDISRYLELVGKTAMRIKKEQVGVRDWTRSELYLYIGRLNYHLTSKWGIGVEYRILTNPQIEDRKDGFLIEVERELFQNIQVGVGYNFTDYEDDLSAVDDYNAEGWFMRLTGKY